MANIEYQDSPFHRTVESDLDRKILLVKTNFAKELEWRMAARSELREVAIFHTPLSIYITVEFVYRNIKTKLNYDLDQKQFREPYHTFSAASMVSVHNGNLYGLYERDAALLKITCDVMSICYEVSKTRGLGTRVGDDWINETESAKLADEEMTRLLRISGQSQKEYIEREARKKSDAEFLERIRTGY